MLTRALTSAFSHALATLILLMLVDVRPVPPAAIPPAPAVAPSASDVPASLTRRRARLQATDGCRELPAPETPAPLAQAATPTPAAASCSAGPEAPPAPPSDFLLASLDVSSDRVP